MSRRDILGRVGELVAPPAAAPSDQEGRARGAGPAVTQSVRLVPRADLVNTLEFEEQAGRRLDSKVFASIAGSDRAPFDRITLRPRMCVPVLDMDLSLTLFGETHFAPILVGPIEQQRRFHVDGELATVKGASAAKAAVIVSSHSSVPLAELVAAARTPLWYQVFANDPDAPSRMRAAIGAGCGIICVTVGASASAGREATTSARVAIDWAGVGRLVQNSTVPVVVKGIASAAGATQAIARGAQGLIVSTYAGSPGRAGGSAILELADIVDAAGRVPVLVDGGFRRGTDMLKALAFGARAVVIGRPVMWGLAAYGADGVQGVVEMLQTELARYMGMCGKPRLAALDRTVLKVHRS